MDRLKFEQAFEQLTPRRKEVLRRVLAGETDAAIAQAMQVGESTVRKHIERICQEFGLESENPQERRSKRADAIALVARYKPELLNQQDVAIANEAQATRALAVIPTNSKSLKQTEQIKDESDRFLLPLLTRLLTTPQPEENLKQQFELCADEAEKKQMAKLLNKIGYSSYLEGDFQRAAYYLKWAIEFNSGLAAAHYNLGSTYEKLEDLPSARKHYQIAALAQNRAADAAISNLARLEILNGNSDKAVDLILPSLNRVKDSAVASSLHKNLGWAYWLQKRYAEAEEHLRKAIELESDRAPAYCLLAQVLEDRGEQKNALAAWENCLKYECNDKRIKGTAWRTPELNIWQLLARERLNAENRSQLDARVPRDRPLLEEHSLTVDIDAQSVETIQPQ